MCEKKTNKYMRREWEFWSRKYLQINIQKRSISRAKQKQKQQNDIDFANVCCFKFFEFEFFEFLLIDAFWLIANYKTKSRLTKYWRIDDDKKLRKKTNWIDCVTNSRWLLFFISLCYLFSYCCFDIIDSFSLMLIAKM